MSLPPKNLLPCILGFVLAFATVAWAPVAAAALPKVRVENIRRVVATEGVHNAFTDLVRWKGKYWLAFRSSTIGHVVNSQSAAVIMCSDDTKTWKEAYRFSVKERDTRDPHFMVLGDKLFVYSGTAHVGKEEKRYTDWNAHLGYATWTTDGTTWATPQALEGTYGHYVWRAASYGGKGYLCARRWHAHNAVPDRDFTTMEAALLESDDGLHWRFVSFLQETQGNETALLFQPDGELIAYSRAGLKGSGSSVLSRSKPPYEKWTRQELDVYTGGPVLAHWGKRIVMGGRDKVGDSYRTGFNWVEGTKVIPFIQLPSGGDNSYPGFVQLDDGRALISWYSSHEKGADGKPLSAIYLAELAIEK